MTSVRKLSHRYEAWLRLRYPRAFSRRDRPPLQVGIKEALRDDPSCPSWASDRVVQDALARWVRHPVYRRNVLGRRPRVGLNGRIEFGENRFPSDVTNSLPPKSSHAVAGGASRREARATISPEGESNGQPAD